MIDLFIVCISFLLITAVWSRMAQLETNAEVPGNPPEPRTDVEAEKRLTVDMSHDDRFVLSWRTGQTVHATSDVPRKAIEMDVGETAVTRYPELAKEIEKQWKQNGSHLNDTDPAKDQAIIRVPNRSAYGEIVAVIDAIYRPKRTFRGKEMSAFNVTFATR